ncbi:hypothetical protein M147_1314 [Bacteroides fragilis str. 1007-1-F |nr:hypothetical protein M147_1314 [Bacteroides fragilis str. 1007-1-F \
MSFSCRRQASVEGHFERCCFRMSCEEHFCCLARSHGVTARRSGSNAIEFFY